MGAGCSCRAGIVAAARQAIDKPPYGRNIASHAYALGLLAAAQILAADAP